MTNVVIVHTDDTGRYIGPYGHDIETPALDRLADDGVCFRNAYCAGPTCSPSRAALLTGQNPHESGMIGLAHRGFSLDHPDRHLASFLSRNGYESVLAGQQHEAHVEAGDYQTSPDYRAAEDILGYDRTLEGDEDAVGDLPIDHDSTRTDLANAAAAADYIRDRDPDDDPFFLSVGLYNTHQPMPLDQDLVDPDHVQPPGPLPDVPPVREEMAAFHVLAQYVDECFETVADALRESGQLEDTLLLFTTDHGIPFPRMKCNLFDGGIGISLITRFPEGYRAGEAEDALVSNIDLFPTFCEYLGIDTPDWVEGTSLMPLVRGDRERVRDEIYSEVTYHAAYEPRRCVRTERYKYIRRYDDEHTGWVRPNTDAGPSKTFLLDHGLFDRDRPKEALYDCYLDPDERENLIDDPEYQDVYEDLSTRLDDWMERTDDPLLEGPVPKPPGAFADAQDGLHPGDEFEPENAR